MELDDDEEKVMITVRITLSLRRRLKIIAAYNNVSMSEKVKDYIERGIKEEELEEF